MKNTILENIDNPARLENLYRANKSQFKRSFLEIFPTSPESPIALCWYERLQSESGSIAWGKGSDLLFISFAALLAAAIAKIPDFFPVTMEFFYPRNISFIVLPILAAYFAWVQKLPTKVISTVMLLYVGAAVYINWLPLPLSSDTMILSCIHLPLVGWSLLGFVFTGGAIRSWEKRPDFLRYNGDLLVMGSLIVSGIMLLTGITIGLFDLIGLSIADFYTKWILIVELTAAPLVATYVIRYNPQLVNKVSPVIARIFSPVVLVTLVAYLVGIAIAKKDPFNDRDFLLLFNGLLIGVLAIIFFSVVELQRSATSKWASWILFLLALVTIIVNGVALLAILYRISSWGFTPNRTAVLGGNLLFFVNLILITYRLSQQVRGHSTHGRDVEKAISQFLPVYSAWAFIVTFLFPLIFGMH
jgi:hypothetical protein